METEAVSTINNYHDRPWLNSLLRPFLIMILIACLDVGILFFLSRFMEVQPVHLQLTVILGALAALIGCYTDTWLAQPTPTQRERRTASYRVAELLLLVATTRIAVWWMMGSWPTLSSLLIAPLSILFDGPFVFSGLIMALSWIIASAMTDDLLALGLQSEELYAATLSSTQAYERGISRNTYIDRREILRRFTSRWVTGGLLLVLLSASVRVELSSTNFTTFLNRNISTAIVVSILLYFLIGLLLISQGELALLRSRWTLQKIPNRATILQNWPFYVFTLVLGIGLLAALLPLGSTFYLAQIFWAIVAFIYEFVMAIFQLVIFLLMALTGGLLGSTDDSLAPPPPPTLTMPSFNEASPPPVSEISFWAGGIFFWLTMSLLLGYAAYIYLSGKGFSFNWLRLLWQMLSARWQQLWQTYQGWQRNKIESTEVERSLNFWPRKNKKNFIPWQERSPTEQVRYFYLSLLEQAANAGIMRIPSETPLQYAPRLQTELNLRQPIFADSVTKSSVNTYRNLEGSIEKKNFSNLDGTAELPVVEELTDAFVQIHYAGIEIEPTQVNHFKRLWQRLSGLLSSDLN